MTDLLRIILLVIGAIILALIYYYGKKKEQDKTVIQDDPIEPNLNINKTNSRPNDLPRAPEGLSVDEAHEEHQAENQLNQKEKIITVFLHAKDGQQFDWHLIQSAAEEVGLELGEDSLYYRFKGFGENKELLFMVANMLKPGIFQPDMRTTGLVLIMTLPGVLPALDMWDTLFPVGERFAQILGGKLTDENHHIFSRQRIAAMRDEMREFDQHHKPN
jgi:cell division protein ZipA